MNTSAEFRFGFRALERDGERKLTDWNAAFRAHIEADPRAMTAGECYLSAFQFPDAFRVHLEATGSTAGYIGPTWTEWIGFDIDRADDLERALSDARRLAAWIVDRFKIDPDSIMLFYSGSKGFHVLQPSGIIGCSPAIDFHECCKRFAQIIAENAGIVVDLGVYARVNLFRAPNSKHRKTGRYKVQLTYDELLNLRPEAIIEMASEPREGWIPAASAVNTEAAECWNEIVQAIESESQADSERRNLNGNAKLNPTTRALLQGDLSTEGDRHRELFSAAANFGEFGSVDELAFALLTPAGLNSGLSASDVRRQIECGLKHGGRHHGE
jgi:hypothetical protein